MIIKKKNFIITGLILLAISLYAGISSASMNLTIQSENEHAVKVVSLNNMSFVVGNSTNVFNLTYDNYIVKLYPDIYTLDNQTAMNNVSPFLNDRYKIIWIAIFFALLLIGYYVLKTVWS